MRYDMIKQLDSRVSTLETAVNQAIFDRIGTILEGQRHQEKKLEDVDAHIVSVQGDIWEEIADIREKLYNVLCPVDDKQAIDHNQTVLNAYEERLFVLETKLEEDEVRQLIIHEMKGYLAIARGLQKEYTEIRGLIRFIQALLVFINEKLGNDDETTPETYLAALANLPEEIRISRDPTVVIDPPITLWNNANIMNWATPLTKVPMNAKDSDSDMDVPELIRSDTSLPSAVRKILDGEDSGIPESQQTSDGKYDPVYRSHWKAWHRNMKDTLNSMHNSLVEWNSS